MTDQEQPRKPHVVRKNPALRPHPGVQKAIQNFGVLDLREFLDKKHQDQDSKPQSNKKLPPPDPSYNYLKDPSRDHARSQRDDKPKKNPDRSLSSKNAQKKPQQTNKDQGFTYTSPKYRETKKELRFSDHTQVLTESDSQKQSDGFKGRNTSEGFKGRVKEDKIENPVNIKIELSTETGQRNYTLDENTKIPDIKHVPDHIPNQRPYKGQFRGRGRGRGNFRRPRGFNTENKQDKDDKNVASSESIKSNQIGKNTELHDVDEQELVNEQEDSFDNEEFEDSITMSSNEHPNEDSGTSFNPDLRVSPTADSSKCDGDVEESVALKETTNEENSSAK
ncbi:hypothetical protein ABEB36_003918 [Hypothenemus hampei]|uniref:Uncharacterized protein n=1 Tax=Hypothenemus hampei TaxID=57062 RepID=A0ABD1F1K1_HYPHA